MPSVLIVEDDPFLGHLLHEALADEGYDVAILADPRADAVRAAAERIEPDCILLDSVGQEEYGESWEIAAWLRQRERPVPTIMFTAHLAAAAEAERAESARSQAAAFAAVLAKPFDLERLLDAVEQACARSVPFEVPATEPPQEAEGGP